MRLSGLDRVSRRASQSSTNAVSLGTIAEEARKKRLEKVGELPPPTTEIKILGSGKTPAELESERARKAHEDSVAKQREKARKRKAGLL